MEGTNNEGAGGESSGTQPPEGLIGSDVQEAVIEVGEGTITLGELVTSAHQTSGISVSGWNALPQDDREALIANELERLRLAALPPETQPVPDPDAIPEGFEWVTVKADPFNKSKKFHINGVEFEVDYGQRQPVPAVLAEAIRNANLAA